MHTRPHLMVDPARTDVGAVPQPIEPRAQSTVLGRGGEYIFRGELAQGGMATVHLGSIRGAIGFVRAVAIKRLHAQYAKNESFVAMLMDEARLASRIRHANVVPILDVVSQNDELYLIMDFVHGVPLHRLMGKPEGMSLSVPVASSIMVGALAGLHAAHEARDEKGQPLAIVHRDVSPQNIMVGIDGTARVLDFGVAKARGRLSYTGDGVVKGKLGYMSPEQLRGKPLDRRTDIYAAGVVLWECIVGSRLVDEGEDGRAILKALETDIRPPSGLVGSPQVLDSVVMRALDPNPARRYQTAQDMASDLEAKVQAATISEVGAWVALAGKKWIDRQAQMLDMLDARSLEESQEIPLASRVAAPTEDKRLHSAVTTAAKSGRKKERKYPAAAGVSLMLLMVAVFWVFARTPRPTHPTVNRDPVQVPHVRQIVAAPATAQTADAPATTTLVDPPVVSPLSSAPAASKRVSATKKSRSSVKAAPKILPEKELDACNPPYVVNAQGIRKYKPQCF